MTKYIRTVKMVCIIWNNSGTQMKNRKHKGKYVVWQKSSNDDDDCGTNNNDDVVESTSRRRQQEQKEQRAIRENRNKRKSILCALAFNIRTSAKVMNESNIIFIFSWSLLYRSPYSSVPVSAINTLLNSFSNGTQERQ